MLQQQVKNIRKHLFNDIVMHIKLGINIVVAGFGKTDPNRTFGILKIINLKYLTHCESLLLGCSHAIFAV